MFVVLKLLCHIQALAGQIRAVKFKGACPCCFSAVMLIIIVQHAGRTVHTVINTCADVTDNASVRPTDVTGSDSSERQARPTADSPTISSGRWTAAHTGVTEEPASHSSPTTPERFRLIFNRIMLAAWKETKKMAQKDTLLHLFAGG